MAEAARHIEPPLALLAELSHRCPLSCPYCSNPLELVRASGELPTGAWISVFEQAARMGVLQVHLSGGEPAVRKDLTELVAAAGGAGLYTNLITSGLLLDKDRLSALQGAGLAHVQLSVQGADAAMTDYVGGTPGAFDHKMTVARWVGELGLALTFNFVLHRQNCHQAADMLALARSFGAQRVEMAHTQYYGWGLENRAALLPGRDQLDAVTALVEAEREKGGLTIDYVVPDYYALRPKACMAGWARRFLTITPDGYVLPCHAAQSLPGLEFERVTGRPLAEIWETNPGLNAYRGTGWMAEPCRSCERAEVDFGGCRCQAFALAGDAAATDPACALSDHHHKLTEWAQKETGAEAPAFIYRRFG